MQTVFGPVNPRRFGTSLGVDLSPGRKQCNFDCLYCELAPAQPVTRMQEAVDVDTVVGELETALAQHPGIDDITVTANGEPTLHPRLGELLERIDAIKGETKTLILTNGTGLTDPAVFDILLRFDRVKVSLDAVTPDMFRRIDRPAPGIGVEAIVEALERFARVYRGELYLEILFVHGVNDGDAEIGALDRVLGRIPCRRIDIGTIDRPPAYPVRGLSYGELHAVAARFDAALPIHIASRTHAEACRSGYGDDEILNTLDKSPLTMEDMRLLFDDPTLERLENLVEKGEITTSDVSGVTFYLPAKNLHRKRKRNS